MTKTTIEVAARVLEENEHLPSPLLDRFRAIVDGNLPRYYHEELMRKRAYSDYCQPGRLVAEWHQDYPHMKCRVGVIVGIGLDLQSMISEEVITDDGLKEKIRQFLSRDWEGQKGAKGQFWTTGEEIDLINDMLDDTMVYLKRTYGLA